LIVKNTTFDQKNCFFALCQNQEWCPLTANILLSNEEIFLQVFMSFIEEFRGEVYRSWYSLMNAMKLQSVEKDPGKSFRVLTKSYKVQTKN